MNYILSNNLSEEIKLKEMESLKEFLSQPADYWLEGTGDTAIKIKDNEQLVFFKIIDKFFIMFHPDYLAPKTNAKKMEVFSHFVGGEEMQVPSTCLCSESEAFKILENYIQGKGLLNTLPWIDFYEELGK